MFKKIWGRARDWLNSARENSPALDHFKPKAHPWEQLEKEEAFKYTITNRHRWCTLGLNRKERRSLIAKLRRSQPAKVQGNGRAPRPEPFDREFNEWLLKHTPRNWPMEYRFTLGMPRSERKKLVNPDENFMSNNPVYGRVL